MAPTYTQAQLELALDDLAKQDTPNFLATSNQYGIPRKTLSDRFTGKTVSRQEASSEARQCLDTAQEEALIRLINRLTNRGLPPTNSIVRNLVEEIIGRRVGKNWSGQFVKRHQDRLTSRYLKNIDRKRQMLNMRLCLNSFMIWYCFICFIACYDAVLSPHYAYSSLAHRRYREVQHYC